MAHRNALSGISSVVGTAVAPAPKTSTSAAPKLAAAETPSV